MPESALAFFSAIKWDDIKAFAESNFVSGLFASMAGAFGGAWAAQRIAERGKTRDKLIEEIGVTNASIQQAIAIFNTFANLREQHLQALWDDYERDRNRVAEQWVKPLNERQITRVVLNMNQFDVGRPRLRQLENSVLERTGMMGRGRAAVPFLVHSVECVDDWLNKRNDIIDTLRTAEMSHDQRLALYFGLPIENQLDESYRDIMNGLFMHTKDSIFYSKSLIDDLRRHGLGLRKQYRRLFRGTPQQ